MHPVRSIIWKLFGPRTVGDKFRWLASRAASARPNQNHGERVVHEISWLIAETSNGSLHQYLANSTGDSFHQTVAYLEEIGAEESRQILRELANAAFPGGVVPANRAQRCDQFLPWADQLSNDQYVRSLTKQFLASLGQLMERVVEYADEHSEYFPELWRSD